MEVDYEEDAELTGEVVCPHCGQKHQATLTGKVSGTIDVEPPERDEP